MKGCAFLLDQELFLKDKIESCIMQTDRKCLSLLWDGGFKVAKRLEVV